MSGAHYVYGIVVDGVTRYVGKGKGQRVQAHMKEVRRITRRQAAGETVQTTSFYEKMVEAWLAGSEIQEVMILGPLLEKEALDIEREIIRGMRDQLWNSRRGWERDSLVQQHRKNWEDPVMRAYHKARIDETLTQDMRDERSTRAKVGWSDPEKRKRRMLGMAKQIEASPVGRLLKLITASPGIAFRELVEASGLGVSKVSTYTIRLIGYGLIERSGPLRRPIYHPTNVTLFARAIGDK